MAYIESFLLFLLVVIITFLVLVTPIVIIGWILSYVEFFNKRKFFQFLFLKKSKLIKDQTEPYFNISKIVKSNAIVFFTIVYITTVSVFYVKQSFNYYGKDRAYPQAKAYAIVGNSVFFIHSFLFSFSRINIHENNLDNKLMAFQDFILNRMYQYIPKDDAEREYWKYKFKYQSIITQRYVPVSKEDRESKYRFFRTEMGIAEYSPRLYPLMDEIQQISKALFYGNMKDIELNQGKRYLPIAHISYYLANNFINYTTLKRPEGDPYTVKGKLMFQDKTLYAKYLEYTNLLVALQEKIDTNSAVKKVFEKNPMHQAFLFASLLDGFDTILRYKVFSNIYPCNLKEAQQFLDYHRQINDWMENKGTSFQTLSRRGQKAAKFILGASGGRQSFFIIAKYICEIPIDYYNSWEKQALKDSNGRKDLLKRYAISGLFKDRFEYEKIILMKETHTKGEEK
ncbi:hypothetical protein [Arcobacter arenosus]|uniref:hypothetical protein n=1 Tax=Arcobacter arenosus TaxID=2576037 RepID=UPI003BA94D7B